MGCSLLYQYLSWSEAGAHTGQPCTCSGQHLIHWQALRDLCAEKNLVPTPAVFIVYASWLLCTFPFPHLKHRKPSATSAPSPACDCCLSLYSGGSVAFTAHNRAGASQAPRNLSSGHWLRRQECNIMGIHAFMVSSLSKFLSNHEGWEFACISFFFKQKANQKYNSDYSPGTWLLECELKAKHKMNIILQKSREAEPLQRIICELLLLCYTKNNQ